MSQSAKRLKAMRLNPQGDWRIEDIAAICKASGVACSPPTRGDHYKISHGSQQAILTIPAHRPIKPVYIRAFLNYLDDVERAT
jgi:hypothetical protein